MTPRDQARKLIWIEWSCLLCDRHGMVFKHHDDTRKRLRERILQSHAAKQTNRHAEPCKGRFMTFRKW